VVGEPSVAAERCTDASVWAMKEAQYHLNIVKTHTSLAGSAGDQLKTLQILWAACPFRQCHSVESNKRSSRNTNSCVSVIKTRFSWFQWHFQHKLSHNVSLGPKFLMKIYIYLQVERLFISVSAKNSI